MRAHQDKSKYTQQYEKPRRFVTFSTVSVFGGVLLAIMLTLSAFATIHAGVNVQPQLTQQSVEAGAMQHPRTVHTPKKTATVTPRKMAQPRKPAPPFPVANVPKVMLPTPTPAPVSTTPPTPVPTQAPAAVPTVAPTPAPTQPVAQPTPGGGSSGSVTAMIDQVFGADAPMAIQVATCESGLNPNAYNPTAIGGSHAAGVFQILYPSTWYTTPEAGLSPYNAMANIEAAHSIFVRDGYSWREWTCQ